MFIDAVERAVRWFQCPTDLAGVKNARYIDRLQACVISLSQQALIELQSSSIVSIL